MSEPFKIDGPAIISVSGGRTSGRMVREIQLAHGGKLPENIKPVFCNTGKEHPATLDFLHDQDLRWGLDLVWVEWVPNDEPIKRFKLVTYETAARNGEPFQALAEYFNTGSNDKGEPRQAGLPNVTNRMCTAHLKIKARQYYAKSIGWVNDWTCAIGLRADEPGRVAKSRAANDPWDRCWPLFEAGVDVHGVVSWWQQQDFDLGLPVDSKGVSAEGNCDLCFLKNQHKKISIIRQSPHKADWWIGMERRHGALFRNDQPNYQALKAIGTRPGLFDQADDLPETEDCACTD